MAARFEVSVKDTDMTKEILDDVVQNCIKKIVSFCIDFFLFVKSLEGPSLSYNLTLISVSNIIQGREYV